MRTRTALTIAFIFITTTVAMTTLTTVESSGTALTWHPTTTAAVVVSHQAPHSPRISVAPEGTLISPPTTTTTVPVVAPTTTTTQPLAASQAPTAVVSTSAPASSSDDAIFNCIIAHESGGDPGAVNPSSGAGGLFQFLPSSWLAYGGGQFASLPNLATADQQWQIARAAKAESGWYPWVGTNCTPVG